MASPVPHKASTSTPPWPSVKILEGIANRKEKIANGMKEWSTYISRPRVSGSGREELRRRKDMVGQKEKSVIYPPPKVPVDPGMGGQKPRLVGFRLVAN